MKNPVSADSKVKININDEKSAQLPRPSRSSDRIAAKIRTGSFFPYHLAQNGYNGKPYKAKRDPGSSNGGSNGAVVTSDTFSNGGQAVVSQEKVALNGRGSVNGKKRRKWNVGSVSSPVSNGTSLNSRPVCSARSLKKKRKYLKRNKDYVCPKHDCGARFISQYGLNEHLESHPGFSVICHKCTKSFANNRCLIVHERSYHKEDAPSGAAVHSSASEQGPAALDFLDVSSDAFSSVAQAWCEKHKYMTVNPLHDFTCTRCKLVFPMRSSLRRHMRLHHCTSAGKMCSVCHQTFSSKRSVVEHHRRVNMRKRELSSDKLTFFEGLGLAPACAADKEDRSDEKDSYVNPDIYKKTAKIKYGPEHVDQVVEQYLIMASKLRRPRRGAY